ncbi:MAG TPA: ABC transporter ATP-binding protein [Holophaga sp.]|nr:ABC transporter ATP-binding protein [Holophaga sp.]HPS66433.1 ABC transporter ATP-binding protein [Holophaga sp.]
MIRLAWKHLKGRALACAVIAPLMMLVEVLMDLQQPALMARIIDVGVSGRDLTYVLATGFRMVVMAAIGFVGGAACSLLAARAAVDMSGRMRQGLFEKVQRLSFAEIDRLKTSSLVTRLTNDVMQMQTMVLMMLRIMVRSPLTLLGSILMSFLLSPRLSLLFCVLLPVVIVSIVLALRRSIVVFSQVQAWLDRMNTLMRESLLGVRVVRSFTIEAQQADRFAAANDGFTDRSIRAQELTFLLLPVVTLVMNLGVVAVLWFGGRMVFSGGLEIGKVMALVNYLTQITHSLMVTVNLVVNVSRAQASTARIKEVLDAEPAVAEPAEPCVPRNDDIEFEQVSLRYGQGETPVLRDLSFVIRQGETVGVIGATGSGKSSLISLIPRLYDASSGRVLIGGVDVRRMGIRELRRRVGLVMQEAFLFSGSVADNLRFGNERASGEAMESAARDAQAAGFIRDLPDGYGGAVEQRGRNFSGGQKQRLSIARTLLQEPRILILDDSTSAVDLITEAGLRRDLARRMKGRTLIVVAQRITAVMDADRILVLDAGRLAASGTHAGLLRDCEIYRSIAVSQLGEGVLAHAG